MEGKRLIEKIRLRNILSFGDKGEEIELQPLNVLIGQNASGKSNFIDVIKLLRDLWQKNNLSSFVGKNGGIEEWIWKGKRKSSVAKVSISISALNYEASEYELEFTEGFIGGIQIVDERIKGKNSNEYLTREKALSRKGLAEKYDSDESVITRYHNFHFGDVEYEFYTFAHSLTETKIYTDLQTNRSAEIRRPQIIEVQNEFLEEDGSNLGIVLNDLERKGDSKDIIIENLKKFYPRVKDYSIGILGGTVQFFLRDYGLKKPVSAMRLSDGTLRYLCLLAILCHPEPPPLICIEEPETGLHPDILPTIGELLIEASKRTQLIVTTHSDILVSSFSEIPEAVLVCEADEDGTHLKRLERDQLKGWLKEYQLGDLWIRGHIGGKRW